MDQEGGQIRRNTKSLAGNVLVIVVACAVVFGIIFVALRENLTRPPQVGHDHVHEDTGGGAPPGDQPAPKGPEGAVEKFVGAPDAHGPGDGHNH